MNSRIYLSSFGRDRNKLVYKQVRVLKLCVWYYAVVFFLEEDLFVVRNGFVFANTNWTTSMLLQMWTEFYGRLKMMSYIKGFEDWPMLFECFSNTHSKIQSTWFCDRPKEIRKNFVITDIVVAKLLQETQSLART